MNKQQEAQQADSVSTVGVSVKDYAPSDVYVSEPPPAFHDSLSLAMAYMKPKATAVQIAKIIAFTVIACSFILGSFMLASAYVQANASCSQLLQAEALLHQQNDDGDHPSLVDPLQSEESMDSKQESSVHSSNSIQEPPQKPQTPPPSLSQTREQSQQQSYFPQGQQSQQAQNDNGLPIQIKLPLQLDFDDIAASLLEKNQRSRMNCVVEKRRAEEVMDHKPKMVRLPFGVNLTTDPRYEHVTGERMAIFCESGQDARHTPMESMPQPIMVPVPMGHPIPMNMPMGGHAPSQQGPYMGPNVPMMSPHMPHAMMGPREPNMMMNPNMAAMNQMGPQAHYHGPYQGPMMGPNMPQPHQPHHSHAPPHVNQIPISIFTKLQQDDASSQRQSGEEQPITIIAREEQVIPIFQAESRPASNGGQISAESRAQQNSEERMPMQSMIAEARLVPEARALLAEIPEDRSVPVPPVPAEMVRPPPLPFQRIPVSRMIQEDSVPEQDEQPRPHYVQPRSVRSTDSVLKSESKKRVRRGTCECLLH